MDPEPIREHYVVIGWRRYPPKQGLAAVTGLDRGDFTTQQARSTRDGDMARGEAGSMLSTPVSAISHRG
ncbi:MAG: hypothetical protein ACT4NP_08080 [Pseudonocardiales bacterium]